MPWLKKTRTTAQTAVPITEQWGTNLDSSVIAYRAGNVVTVVAWRLGVLEDVAGEVLAYELPLGWRPVPLLVDRSIDSRGALMQLSGGAVRITNPSRSVSHHSFTFVTLDPMPTGGA